MPTSSSAPRLILASASPRRQALLVQLGVAFTVLPADIDERRHAGEVPRDYAIRMAHTKAHHVAQLHPDALVLGADTIVTVQHYILGKPGNAAEASEMLRRLSGRQHTVLTGLALMHEARQFRRLDAVQTLVRFHTLSEAQLAWYVGTGEPFDKAGAYAIQGHAAAFIEGFEGCYTNVVGLPLRRTAELLRTAGISVPEAPEHSAKNAW